MQCGALKKRGRSGRRTGRRADRWAVLVFGLLFLAPAGAVAQGTGDVVGRVVASNSGEPLVSALVEAAGSGARVTTNADGRFHLPRLAPGEQAVRVTAIGFQPRVLTVTVGTGETTSIEVPLEVEPIQMPGITVSVLRPDLRRQSRLEQEAVREANPRDPGELLRQVSGVDAARRGALGLDPNVQALVETEVGSYVDGERRFPAGPARMDSPLTHVDPLAFRSIEVVKGPYALTWGAGNLSAIRIETESLPPERQGPLHGNLTAGYDTNVKGFETSAGVLGRSGALSYWGFGAYREGDDYKDGNGDVVPAKYESWELRGKIGLATGTGSRLVLGGGYQEQGPIDYPGRILDAEFFETWNVSGRWLVEGRTRFRGLDVMAYYNEVDHGMSNREKPSAAMNDIRVNTSTKVGGGRAAALFRSGGWDLELGGDVYSSNRNAVRQIRMAATGMVMLEDLVWPDATITAGGLFLRAARAFSGIADLSGTLRLDLVDARADTASQWFLENVSTELDGTETNLSGALTLGIHVSSNWNVFVGAGSAVRTADATERYSDRFPASKAQMPAEFVGNPALKPERSTQFDVGLEGSLSSVWVQANVFGRKIDDYVTLTPTAFEKKLPISPDVVYQYVNGDARFWGIEAAAAVGVARDWTVKARTDYLWGEDETLDEPALGVIPWRGQVGLRYEEVGQRFYGEATVDLVDSQDRVATSRGETPTDGYVTGDLRFGLRLHRQLLLRFGVQNVGDKFFVNHLNSKNPFTGNQIPEPGRILYFSFGISF